MAETDTKVTTPQPPPKRRWLKVTSIILVVFILLLVIAYFVGTSSAFLTGVVLPRVSKSVGAEITVSDASISPFKEVVLHNLRVKTTGDEPLVSVAEVHARYSLMDIIRGKIKVDEVAIGSATVVIVENPDGSKNTDAFTKPKKNETAMEKPKGTSEVSKTSKPPQIDIKKVGLTDATVRQIKLYPGGKRDVIELAHVNIALEDLKNGQSGKLSLSSDLNLENNAPKPTENGILKAKVNGSFTLALTPDLKPASIQGNTRLEITSSTGAFADLATLAANLNCDISPTEIKKVSLEFSKAASALGQIRVFGPFNLEKNEGKITVQILALDKQVLNIAGAKNNLDFGTTTVNSTNQIELTKGGSAIAALGQLSINQLQVNRGQQTTPTLDLLARYNVALDQSASNAVIRELTLTGTQNGRTLLSASVTSPMSLGFSGNSLGDSSFLLVVTNLDLAEWKPLVGEVAPAGIINVNTTLSLKEAGKLLTFDFMTDIAGLTVTAGTNRVTDARVNLQASGTAHASSQFNFSDFSLANYRLQISRQNQTLVACSGLAKYDLNTQTANLELKCQAFVDRLLQALPQPNVAVSSGTVDMDLRVTQKDKAQTLGGALKLADLSARFGSNDLRNLGATLSLDVNKTPSEIQLRRISGNFTQGGKAGGDFDLTGTYGTNQLADISLTKASFNQELLRPFLQPALAEKQLVSVTIGADANIHFDPNGASAIKANAKVENLVVKDPKNQFPETPLGAGFAVDLTLKKQVADINKLLLALTPTQKAKNELQLTGHLDMSNTNYTQGNLALLADALDVTTYYDLFMGGQKAETKPGTKASKAGQTSQPVTQPQSSPDQANKEPDPIKLPVNNFTFKANMGHFYLHEVEIAQLDTQAKIDVSHVVLNPFKLQLNGAPVNTTADIDLSVPGYNYSLVFGAQAIPLAPLVNTFAPDRKGQIAGTLTANANVQGAGTTGASLQKSLNGQFDISSTNLNFSVVNVRSRIVRLVINLVASVPDLLHGSVGGLVESVTGLGNGGLMDELKKSPIDAITTRGVAGSGKVELQQAVVQSAAFRADAHGTVTLAPVLTNSPLQLPVAIALSQPIAKRLGVGSEDTNAAYAGLPDFVLIEGTVGDPKPNRGKLLVLATAAGKGLINALAGTNSTGNLIKGGLNLLGGTSTPAANATTNQTGTNKSQNLINEALDIFGKKKKQ